MLGRSFILLCLIVSSLVTTAVVHAQEVPSQAVLDCSGTMHVDDDRDQTPADADPGVAHHHGCHAPSAFMPAGSNEVGVFAPGAMRPVGMAPVPPARLSLDPDLRPPIA
ncbi:MAG TPA: hypothetical protein VNS79_00070 [Sphingobium sp.]|nr:hypothetical protein [Sphingobium sp.]